MPWLVRYTPKTLDRGSASDLLNRHAMLVSALWDLGTSGIAEQSVSLVAGFDRLDTAQSARRLAGRYGLVAEIEAVDDGWVRHDRVEVAVTTAAGPERFPVVAGSAFGHGGHPTTRLCLDLMSNVFAADGPDKPAVPPSPRVLDLGTGSGVLAVAAHRLGATDITASDVETGAIDSARFNAAVNGVDVRLVHGDVDQVAAVADRAGVRFDLIVANVLLAVHEHVAPAAGSLLQTNGMVVVAGFLADQADRVVAAYRDGRPTLNVIDRMLLEDWCGLVLAETPISG